MSLRQYVLEKSLKEEQNKTSNKSGLSSSTTASRRTRGNKKNKMVDSEKENRETSQLEEKLNSPTKDTMKAIQNLQLSEKQREDFAKWSRQDITDKLVEYIFKYDRLSGVMDQLKEHIIEMRGENTKTHKDLSDSRNETSKHLFTLEGKKFRLEEENQETKTKEINLVKERDELFYKVQQLEKESKKYLEDLNETYTPLTNKQEFIEKLQRTMHCTASTPNELPRNRCRRKSILNQTMSGSNTDIKAKLEIYEDVIINQQEILDFYSLLTGVSISKKVEVDHNMTEYNESMTKEKFKCRLQIKHPLDGYEFSMVFDPSRGEIDFKKSLDKKDRSPPACLKSSHSYDADQAYLFLRDLLGNL